MSGSGNDFVFLDARSASHAEFTTPSRVQAVCARGTGIGADGIVFLLESDVAETALRMRYLNADGSLAAMCGNAALCTTRLARELGVFDESEDLRMATDSGVVTARMRHGRPEIDLAPIAEIAPEFAAERGPGEERIGFIMVGVPHLVVLCNDVDDAPVVERGRELRRHPLLASGANVNFVSRGQGAWRMRTYERGVEAETLACGTGAVGTAVMLERWGLSGPATELRTRSGRSLAVALSQSQGVVNASLAGEGRIVFVGEIGELPGD